MSTQYFTDETRKLSTANRIPVPKQARRNLNVGVGDEIDFVVTMDDNVRVEPSGKVGEGGIIVETVKISPQNKTTIPQQTRDYLGLTIGDEVSFRVDANKEVFVVKK